MITPDLRGRGLSDRDPDWQNYQPLTCVGDIFSALGLADEGYLYLPPQCRGDGACRVHLFFHGCGQSAAQIGTVLAEKAGFLRWANGNDLVILFPQVAPSNAAPVNPLGCWDWWGYSGENYLQKNAPQLRAVHAMLERLQSAP